MGGDLVHIIIDGRPFKASPGESVLDVALRNSIYIPHLCHMPHAEDLHGACRLCLVEVKGIKRPVASCTTLASDGLEVRTDTPLLQRLRRSALRLILSTHRVDCGRCHANKRCALQDLARRLEVGLRPRGLRQILPKDHLDESPGAIFLDRSKCVLCGRCVRICRMEGTGGFHLARRGLETYVAFFPDGVTNEVLTKCLQACPVGALMPSDFRP
jgi:NADH dehydrogenase/NADH:ubiquinone oxidoreductase subunit G